MRVTPSRGSGSKAGHQRGPDSPLSTYQNPQAIHNDLNTPQIARVWNSQIQVADHPVGGHTPSPPSLQMRATTLSIAKPRRAKTPERAIQHSGRQEDPWCFHTGRCATTEWQGEVCSRERVDPRQRIGKSGGEEHNSSWTTLTQHNMVFSVFVNLGKRSSTLKCCFDCQRSLILPTLPWATRLMVFRVTRRRTSSNSQTSSRWNVEPMNTIKRSGNCRS